MLVASIVIRVLTAVVFVLVMQAAVAGQISDMLDPAWTPSWAGLMGSIVYAGLWCALFGPLARFAHRLRR